MSQSYSGPILRLDFWMVTKRDLEKIKEFLEEAFGSEKVEISVETSSLKSKVYTNFKEFCDDAETMLSLDEEIQKISIGRSDAEEGFFRRHIWIEIEFVFNLASFHIFAEEEKGFGLKEWVQDTYDKMQVMVKSFETPVELREPLRRDFLPDFPQRRRIDEHGLIILDYDGNITARLYEEINRKRLELPAEAPLPVPWYRTSQAVIIAILALILLINILLFFR